MCCLFASLLIGTIFGAIGKIPYLEIFADIGGFAKAGRMVWIWLPVGNAGDRCPRMIDFVVIADIRLCRESKWQRKKKEKI